MAGNYMWGAVDKILLDINIIKTILGNIRMWAD